MYKREYTMHIFCYPAKFRIKTKADAEKFLTISEGDFRWSDGETDYWMSDGRVSTRPVQMRGNVFSPYMDDGRGYAELVWKTRKYINAKLAED